MLNMIVRKVTTLPQRDSPFLKKDTILKRPLASFKLKGALGLGKKESFGTP
jgi:hypothetical protein